MSVHEITFNPDEYLYHEVIVAGTQSAKGGQLGDLHHYKD